MPPVSLYILAYCSLAPESLDGFIQIRYLEVCHRSVPSEYDHSSYKNRGHSNGSQTQNGGYFKKRSNDFDQTLIYAHHLHKQS
jgi:hypothetical protein